MVGQTSVNHIDEKGLGQDLKGSQDREQGRSPGQKLLLREEWADVAFETTWSGAE